MPYSTSYRVIQHCVEEGDNDDDNLLRLLATIAKVQRGCIAAIPRAEALRAALRLRNVEWSLLDSKQNGFNFCVCTETIRPLIQYQYR